MVIRGGDIHQSVRREDHEVWRWKMESEKGRILDQGIMTRRLAAQVTVQRAFEQRLIRAGINKWKFTGYRWTEVVG